MVVKKILGFSCENLTKKAKKEGKYGHFLIFIIYFVFSQCIQDLMGELEIKFSSQVGNSHYHRTMLLGIYLYCFKEDITIIKCIEKKCHMI
jgi:hypothetical protein